MATAVSQIFAVPSAEIDIVGADRCVCPDTRIVNIIGRTRNKVKTESY